MEILAKFIVVSTLAVASIPGFAGGGGGGAPEISSGATVTVRNNKASKIVSGGGSANLELKGLPKITPNLNVDASGETNVNSVIVSNGGKISGTVLVEGNKADDVYNFGGGSINVNSVVLK